MVQTWGILIYGSLGKEGKSLSLKLVFNFLGLSMITQYLVYPIKPIDFDNVKRRLERQTATLTIRNHINSIWRQLLVNLKRHGTVGSHFEIWKIWQTSIMKDSE